MKESEKRAKEWIKSQRKSGKPDFSIKAELMQKGYPSVLISRLLERRKFPFFIPVIIIIAAALYFLIPAVLSYVSNLSVQTCADQACFLSAANNCGNAKFQQLEAGSLFEYNAKNCVLTKTAKTLNETEPVEIKNLLEGKSLTCAYAKSNFNENWINTLSIGIENCSGDLKDVIDELVYSI